MNRDSVNILFSEYDLYSVLANNLKKVNQEVDSISEKQFQHNIDDQIIEHVYSKMKIIPIELHEDAKEMDTQEIQIDVRNDPRRAVSNRSKPCLIPGLKVIVSIPFSGDSDLWRCQPSQYTLNPPHANVNTSHSEGERGFIEIIFSRPSDSLDNRTDIKQNIDSNLKEIHKYINNIRRDVETHNQRLYEKIKQSVISRKKRIGKHAEIIKSLNIPLKRSSDAPNIEEIPMKQKIVRPLKTENSNTIERTIREKDNEHILKVIRHEGRSFEMTPKVFAKHNEEELRDIILAHLNGHYEGLATGETFRKKGKTDIRIEYQNRSAFVAECKVWKSPSDLLKSVEQLLGYLIWRDTKGALIIFNKTNSGFSDLLKKVPETLKTTFSNKN